jgi:hypothetical protein
MRALRAPPKAGLATSLCRRTRWCTRNYKSRAMISRMISELPP